MSGIPQPTDPQFGSRVRETLLRLLGHKGAAKKAVTQAELDAAIKKAGGTTTVIQQTIDKGTVLGMLTGGITEDMLSDDLQRRLGAEADNENEVAAQRVSDLEDGQDDLDGRVGAIETLVASSESANAVFAGPASGASAPPTFRALVDADLPTVGVTPGSYTLSSITVDAHGRITAASSGSGGAGTVTSVAMSLPTEFAVTGSPVTTSGTLAATWATQSANLFWAGPSSGSPAAPTFRALAVADMPAAVVAWPVIIPFVGTPANSQVFTIVPFTQAVLFASGLTGSKGRVLTTNPAATYTITLTIYNSSGVSQATGSVTISTGGVFTFTWASSYTTSAGDFLAVTGQATADANLKDFALTVLGTAA